VTDPTPRESDARDTEVVAPDGTIDPQVVADLESDPALGGPDDDAPTDDEAEVDDHGPTLDEG